MYFGELATVREIIVAAGGGGSCRPPAEEVKENYNKTKRV